MKKIVALFVVLSCLSIGAFALETEQASPIDTVNLETETIAYMDLQEASPALQEEILQAREAIIFSNSWVVDGYNAHVGRADGSIEVLPKFSTLFPGWDVPVDPSGPVTPVSQGEDSSTLPEISPLSDWDWYKCSEYLEPAVAGTMATPFTTANDLTNVR